MAQFHFVEDYEKLVDQLVAQHPMDEAMALAVGGGYEHFGEVELDILCHAGLDRGMTVLDLGCGSGRLAHAIGKSRLRVEFTGVDVVQRLLDYAATKSPKHYRFIKHHELSVPAADATVDMLSGFSIFTHLLHQETYIYLQDAFRALKPGGVVVFSFLEFAAPNHWVAFLSTVESSKANVVPHLNTFIERGVITLWAGKLGFEVVGFIGPDMPAGDTGPLGQTTAILRKP